GFGIRMFCKIPQEFWKEFLMNAGVTLPLTPSPQGREKRGSPCGARRHSAVEKPIIRHLNFTKNPPSLDGRELEGG
ncbi:MAG: hypothetical protein V2A66_04495, partial [Pseudomonadota bacterium]